MAIEPGYFLPSGCVVNADRFIGSYSEEPAGRRKGSGHDMLQSLNFFEHLSRRPVAEPPHAQPLFDE